MNSYEKLLKDPRWQRKRLEALSAAEWKCQSCKNDKLELHVHHKKYISGKLPWEYATDQLRVVCKTCHEAIHGKRVLYLAETFIQQLSDCGLRLLVCRRNGFTYWIDGHCWEEDHVKSEFMDELLSFDQETFCAIVRLCDDEVATA